MYTHIVVTTEGSHIDHAAVRHAAGLTRALGARLTLLHIVPDAHETLSADTDLSVSPQDLERAWFQEGEQALADGTVDAACSRLSTVQRAAGHRSVARAILEECAALGGDLLVMATHGRSGWQRLMQGSVAEDVVHHAHVPVLLVHQGTA